MLSARSPQHPPQNRSAAPAAKRLPTSSHLVRAAAAPLAPAGKSDRLSFCCRCRINPSDARERPSCALCHQGCRRSPAAPSHPPSHEPATRTARLKSRLRTYAVSRITIPPPPAERGRRPQVATTTHDDREVRSCPRRKSRKSLTRHRARQPSSLNAVQIFCRTLPRPTTIITSTLRSR